MINPHIICRETEKAAWAQHKRILDQRDEIALGNFVAAFQSGDQTSWRGHAKEHWAVGGNVHLVGTPEQIVDWLGKLKRAGCDGVQINFYNLLRCSNQMNISSNGPMLLRMAAPRDLIATLESCHEISESNLVALI